MAELIIRSGKHQGKKLVLPASRVLIGRDASCQIRLASTDVSRQHCSLRVSPEGIYVRDLGSRNGTHVNETLIATETLLSPGDMLRIGPILLQVPKKKEPQPAHSQAPGRNNSGLQATDEDIASWLSDEETETGIEGPGQGDTTIISNKDRTTTVPLPPAPKAAPPARRQFKSVADEAADIIRRHWEIVRAAEVSKPPHGTS
jgi:pSer/pThr/pTyr-binding forkhead associated (FHA) protein